MNAATYVVDQVARRLAIDTPEASAKGQHLFRRPVWHTRPELADLPAVGPVLDEGARWGA